MQPAEIVLADLVRIEKYLLDHGTADGRVLDHLHVTLAVEERGIVALAHEETLQLPVATVYGLDLVAADHAQRKQDALHLELAVGSKVVKEIVEQLVGGFRYGQLAEFSQQRIDSRKRIVNNDTVSCRLDGSRTGLASLA